MLGDDDFRLTDNAIKNIHNYSLDGVNIDLSNYAELLNKEQLGIINVKYKDKIGKRIILPDDELVLDKGESQKKINALSI